MSATDIFAWIIVPYVCIATFVLGHGWRYRYDKFGWTTRSSQLYERRLLRWGSPLFHFGLVIPGTVPLIAGAVSLLAQSGGGLYWIVGGIVGALLSASVNAWVLLVELLR